MKTMHKLLSVIVLLLIVNLMIVPVCAAEIDTLNTTPSLTSVEPRADVIEYIYRVNNGVYQFRRWNATQGYWIDPYWIDM